LKFILVPILQLNILSYDIRDLSGQRSCHPAQVLGVKKEMKSPFILMNRYYFLFVVVTCYFPRALIYMCNSHNGYIHLIWLRTLARAA
jgi:hypothetical protein